MKKLLTLFVIGVVVLFQVEGQSPRPRPQPPRPPSGQAQAFASGGMTSMDSAFQEWTPEDEYYLGRAVAAHVLDAYRPYLSNQPLTAYLNRICQTLVINSSKPVTFNGYHVLILDTPEFNAFASPGGHIFVTRGLVEAASSEDMLAALIAHELAHIILRHGIKLIDDMSIFNDAALAASQGAALSGSASARKLMSYRNSVAGMLDTMIKNGYSQTYEFEADREALKLLASAGYDPAALVDMLLILQRVQSSQRGGFNATHPTPAARIVNLDVALMNYRVQDTKSYRVPRFKNK